MNLLRRLWRLEGTVDRKTYILGGAIGFAVKFAIDWTVATQLFGLRWTPLSYWKLLDVDGPRLISPASFAVMLAVSLPFLWFGMAMTLLRLRDAGRTAGWAALFFVPVVKRRNRREAPARLSPLGTRAVPARTAAERTHTPDGNDVVPPSPLAIGLLAPLVRRDHPPHPHARSAAHRQGDDEPPAPPADGPGEGGTVPGRHFLVSCRRMKV